VQLLLSKKRRAGAPGVPGEPRSIGRSVIRKQLVEDPRVGQLLGRAWQRAAARLVDAIQRDPAEGSRHAQGEPALSAQSICARHAARSLRHAFEVG
jgi:hypothetical protein